MRFMVPLKSPPKVDRFSVRHGSEADIALRPRHVRFTPQGGHSQVTVRCPLCANKGREQAQQSALFDHLVGDGEQV
jgi:hypothetical protein